MTRPAARYIHVHRHGSGPALVFLHGWTMAGDIFADAFRRLGDRFSCIAPDLPGHGRTEGYAPDVHGATEMLADLLQAEDLRNVTLIGWSLGALVGWSHLRHGGGARIGAMVSLDMSPRPLNGGDWSLGLHGQTAQQARAKGQWFRDDWASAANVIARSMFAGPQGAPGLDIAQASARISAQDPQLMAGLWDSLVACDCRDTIRRLPVPLLAIHGAASRAYPQETAHWLANSAPRGAFSIMPQAGHSPLLEQPDATCAEIAQFALNPESRC
ncbi:alpha/beta fold hydrolase [Roseinatronobacter sp. S2]|uniref:alpha/beta fold hydrolase n=1 Tax=Roseinatronobacter sp. S2 TaxID=3035471 RepID=UPI00240F4F78|nr:alpha/beta hydrolase [Roseinatronobacter sp. S2]WFE76911.1 alpha/beta hydrolase [Roseinatronobacter sp. S2]